MFSAPPLPAAIGSEEVQPLPPGSNTKLSQPPPDPKVKGRELEEHNPTGVLWSL
ncbi:uncharacterized protein AKAME5_002060000, partial [Lates japonicus]